MASPKNICKRQFATIKTDLATVKLLRIYCALTGKTISDFIKELVDRELNEFKEKLERMKKIDKLI